MTNDSFRATNAEKPLDGLTVLEVGQFIAGPYAGQQLADLGARVIKIERPGQGDLFRLYVTKPKLPGYGHNFLAFNRNKLSVALDLQQEAGRSFFKRLAARADVVIENFRAGVLDRLGVGYETLKQINPRLVYCSISGFSEDGPYRDRPSFDTVGQSLSGMLHLFTDPTDPRMRGPTVADQATAMQAATAVLAALFARSGSGVGTRIDISIIEAAIHFMPDAFTAHTEAGIDMESETRTAYSHAFVLRCADDQLISVHVGGPDRLWTALLNRIDDCHFCENPLFANRHSRIAHFDKLIEALRPIFRTRSRATWLEILVAHDIAAAPVNTVSEAMFHPEVRHLDLFEKAQRPGYGEMTMMRRAARLEGLRAPQQLPPPLLGEHTESVLREIGYSRKEIATLRRESVV